jgi:hypothetical protein
MNPQQIHDVQVIATVEKLYGPRFQDTMEAMIINSLDQLGYQLRRPISVSIENIAPGEFVASFEEAEISMSGSSATDAVQGLLYALISVYQEYTGHPLLGPIPAKQLRVLEKYLG